jgi:hypothetical protein
MEIKDNKIYKLSFPNDAPETLMKLDPIMILNYISEETKIFIENFYINVEEDPDKFFIIQKREIPIIFHPHLEIEVPILIF